MPLPEPRDGEVLARVLHLSLDPAIRGWMNEERSYIAPVAIGDVMRAGAVGIVASKHPTFAARDNVSGALGVQEYAALDGAQLAKVDRSLAPLPTFLNTLGIPGMTAYFGLLDASAPKEGDTVVVSGAAGAVGATVGSRKSRDAARWVSRGVLRNTATSSTSSGLMRRLTTRRRICVRIARTGSMSISIMSAATSSTPSSPWSRVMPRRGLRSHLAIEQHDAD
jgi:hypothetical protein